jgi:hypothetical protein
MPGLDEPNRQALRHAPLLRAAVEFHACPACYLHPARLSEFGFSDAGLFGRLLATKTGARRLSESISRRANLPSEGGFRFAEDRFRIALLPFATLERLFGLAAAATLRQEIARVVERSARERLEAAMGAEARDFALKEAAVTLGALCEDRWAGLSTAEDDDAKFRRNRARCLEDCMADAPAALTARLQLKLPPSWGCEFGPNDRSDRAERAWTIVRRLLRAKTPDRGGPVFQN